MPFQGTRVPVTRRSAEAGWRSRGACRDVDQDLFFPSEEAPAEQVRVQEATAKAVCRSCPVAGLCLSQALDERLEFGVWGGLTADDRRAVLASRSGAQPTATSTPPRTADPTRRTRIRRRTTVRRTAPAATVPVTAADLAPVAVSV